MCRADDPYFPVLFLPLCSLALSPPNEHRVHTAWIESSRRLSHLYPKAFEVPSGMHQRYGVADVVSEILSIPLSVCVCADPG